MRTAIVAILLLGAAGVASGEAVRQDEPPMVFQRVCNVVPGLKADAEALAREMVDIVGGRYPGAEMSARTGRWMTGFQNIERPVDWAPNGTPTERPCARTDNDDPPWATATSFRALQAEAEALAREIIDIQQLHRDPVSRTPVVGSRLRRADPRVLTTPRSIRRADRQSHRAT